MLKLKIDYPNKEQEREILDRIAVTDKKFDVKAVISPADIAEVRSVVDEIYIDEKIKDYIVDIVCATREPEKYGLERIVVIQPEGETLSSSEMKEAYLGEGKMVNSEPFNGMHNLKAMDAISDHLEEKGEGRRAVNFRLKDWGISRQRYWGNPIPIIYCDSCGAVPVPDVQIS